MGQAFDKGIMLVMSLWDDYDVDMLWLDSSYPVDESVDKPGVARGTCGSTPVFQATSSLTLQVPQSYTLISVLGHLARPTLVPRSQGNSLIWP